MNSKNVNLIIKKTLGLNCNIFFVYTLNLI